MKIAVFGAGYVGLVTGACLADLGHDVVVRDIVESRIDTLRGGKVPIHEHGLAELLERNRERLSFTTDVAEAIEGADVVFVAVGTPPTASGDADLTAVWTVVDELPRVDRRIVLAMKSTVPVGTGNAVRHRLDERGLENVGYVSNPEFTAEGTAVHDFTHPDRIVVGAFDPADAEVVVRLHAGIDAPMIEMRRRTSAEMIKLAVERSTRHAHLASSTRSRTCARRRAQTCSTSPKASASTIASGQRSCAQASAGVEAASGKTSRRSSSSPATPATASSY